MLKCITYDISQSHSSWVCEDWATDSVNLPGYHTYGKEEAKNNFGRLGDLCIDMSTGNSYWLTTKGWISN